MNLPIVESGAANAAHSLCWSCRAEVGPDPVCPHCVKIQPLGRNSDYFSVMGLPRRLGIDPHVLEPIFHALSRRFHPDVYRLASPRERMIALENSAVLNQAYRTLRDPFDRAAYLADLELGRETGGREQAPQALFEAALEVMELLAEYRAADEAGQAQLRPALLRLRDQLQAEADRGASLLTGELFPRWDAGEREPVLSDMRRILAERSYLRRSLASLDTALGAGSHLPSADGGQA
jgi:molecular chaperone HscB